MQIGSSSVCVNHLQQLRGKDHHIGLPGIRLVVGILLCHGENPPYKGAGCHTSCAFFRHFITSRASLQQGTFHPRQLFTPPTVKKIENGSPPMYAAVKIREEDLVFLCGSVSLG